MTYVQAPPEWRGTSNQVAGLWPFAAGAGGPMIGVPVGRHFTTGTALCCDPISWFTRAKLISNPSAFFLSLPGLGKSTLVRRLILGCAAQGIVPLILGDLKPDHVPVIRALDGDVIEVGRSRGYQNILDAQEALAAAERLTGRARAEIVADARGRRLTMVCALLTILRAQPPEVEEELLLERAITILDESYDGVPVLPDLIDVLVAAPDALRQLARDRGDLERYHDAIDPLVKALTALLGRGRLGELFSQQTTTPMRRDVPTVFDLSSIDDGQVDLQRAALLACWATGFGSVAVGHALADAGVEPRRHHLVVMDELWRALRGGRGLVDRVDALSRLNRTRGVGTVMVSHTLADLQALPDADDQAKARGLVERSGMVILGGLPDAEMPGLSAVVGLSASERDLLTSWVSPPSWDSTERAPEPPGRGKFLIKVGGRPGLPFRLTLTAAERALSDSNERWT